MTKGGTANRKRLVLLLWILVALFYFYLSYDYIRATTNDRQFVDYMHRVVQVAALQRRPTGEIRTLLLEKAAELSLPVTAGQIDIQGSGELLKVVVNYSVDIEVPVFERSIYTKRFEHQEGYEPAR